jgi:hypothetical protein
VNRQHNYGLAIVCSMVVACVGLLRHDGGGALTLVLQLATGVAGGIIGNAMRGGQDTPKGPGA